MLITDQERAVFAEITAGLEPSPAAPVAAPELPPLGQGLQAQGDLLFAPTGRALPFWAQVLQDHPIPIIAEGNGHQLRAAAGIVMWAPSADRRDLCLIGVLDVAAGGAAIVEQPGGGHDPLGIGPGRYEIRRQRQGRGWVRD